MRVRLTVSISGPQFSLRPGEETDLDTVEAGRLIAAGFAVPVAPIVHSSSEGPAQPEVATSKAAVHREKAVQKKAR